MNNKDLFNFDKIVSGDLSNCTFAKKQGEALLLSVYIQPNANETVIVGLHDDRLKIKIATLPVDGMANKTLCEYIAKQLSVHKKNVSVIKGESSRKKILRIII